MSFVIVGLGNPGKEYEKTRHNAGRGAVMLLAPAKDFIFNKKANALVAKAELCRHLVSDTKCRHEIVTLILPETMMNASGKAVAAFIKSPKAAKSMLVVHDDLDLPLGTVKMVFGRGSGGHKGVESVMRAIKTEQFARVRIGIAPAGKKNSAKKFKNEEKVVKHVIGKWKPAEETVVKKVLKKAAEAARLFATEGLSIATQFANTNKSKEV